MAKIPGTKKLAIFCHSLTGANGSFELYVINHDMNSIYGNSEYVEINPRIKFSGDEDWVGCVLKSTLYLFHDCKDKCDYVNENGTDEVLGYNGPLSKISVKKFNLSPEFLDSGRVINGTDEFIELAPMRWPKTEPIAVLTPDGKKILVFQSIIELGCARTCFELYDQLVNCWSEVDLPDGFPQRGYGWSKYMRVIGYKFVDDSSFVMFTDAGTFVLNLKLGPKLDTRQVIRPENSFSHASPEAYFYSRCSVVIDGEVSIGPGQVSRFPSGDDCDDCRFEVSPPPSEEGYIEPKPFIVLLDFDKEYAKTLVSQTHLYETFCGKSYLTIDVCCTDLATLDTTVLGTLKYVIFSGIGLMTLFMYFI